MKTLVHSLRCHSSVLLLTPAMGRPALQVLVGVRYIAVHVSQVADKGKGGPDKEGPIVLKGKGSLGPLSEIELYETGPSLGF